MKLTYLKFSTKTMRKLTKQNRIFFKNVQLKRKDRIALEHLSTFLLLVTTSYTYKDL